jgi:hypothetical protein
VSVSVSVSVSVLFERVRLSREGGVKEVCRCGRIGALELARTARAATHRRLQVLYRLFVCYYYCRVDE